jgi:hypothetical protein
MKKVIAIAAMIAAFGLGGAAAFAAGTDKPANPGGGNDGQVCPDNDTGHISASTPSVTATAPDGKLISGYCVKAGSANQGLGPEFVTVDPPQKTVTITHSSGKDISHYSLSYVDEGEETTETTETTETETTETETTETETTETETTESTPTTPETTTTETTTETSTTETTTESSTPEDPPAEEDVEEQSDPVVQVKSAEVESQSGPAAVVGPARATKPSKAAQPAPLTP